jgi:RNA polymerase sigma factor (sigma-70 family)
MVLDAPVPAAPETVAGPTDLDLVARVRRGDDRAFETLYSRYQRRISAYVYGMVKDHGRAEDITQEVFISALRRMRETDRAIAFKPWIYEIAKNACIDQFRRSRRAEEISMDAGEGLGHADHGRLVAGDPTPDDAVDAKQQLDHLCGAFGGLSDSHHEILVLREFEGLSYREIGDRMGLSRPGVESTLFRARKRLTEEYDELVSGQRCVRIQSIITSACESTLGARDSRRLARHIAHCQPCRRQAVASGLDSAVLAQPKTVRRAVERVAGLLPIPGFLRSRFWPEQMVPVSEPMAAAWSKAVAVAATVIVAGVGAGVAPRSDGSGPDLKQDKAKPAATKDLGASTPAPGPKRAAAAAAAGRTRADRTTSRTRARRDGGLRTPSRAASPRGTAPDSGGQSATRGSKPVAPTTAAGVNPTAAAPQPTRGVQAPTAPDSDQPRAPELPRIQLPSLEPTVGANQVGGTVNKAVEDTTQAVEGTTGAVQETVEGVTGGVLP